MPPDLVAVHFVCMVLVILLLGAEEDDDRLRLSRM
jgi:hypothetical protein